MAVGMVLCACSSSDSWNFSTDYFKISVNNKGYITSMKNIAVSNGPDFAVADKPSPIMSLYNESAKEYYYPVSASYSWLSSSLSVEFSNGSVAKISIKPKDKYIKMTLADLTNRENVDDVQWGSYQTSITNLFGDILGCARDTSATVNYAIGILALDDNTTGGLSNIEGDAGPNQYVIHNPDPKTIVMPDSLKEGTELPLGGDGHSDVAFFAYKEPYYRIVSSKAAMVNSDGQVYIQYHSRDRSRHRQVFYSLLPNKIDNEPNHIDVEPIPGVDYIGSSIALWGSPDDIALMDVIHNVVLEEGLPHPTIDGKWIKDPSACVPDIICSGNLYDSIPSYIEQLGFKAISAYDLGFIRVDRNKMGYIDGKDFSNKPFHLTSGDLSTKEFASKLLEKGYLVGRACITTSMAPGTKDASPVPTDSVCYQQKRVLMNNLSATDTIIEIDDPTYMEEIASWEAHCKNLNMIKIGKELIHYLGVTTEPPYRLLNVTRGYWGTTPTSHAPGDTILKVTVTIEAGYQGLIPNLALQDEIAKLYAEICAVNDMRYYDFDGFEFLWNNGHGYYSTKRFLRTMFDHAKSLGVDYIRFTGAGFNEGSWHYQSVNNAGGGTNLYDTNLRVWGSSTSQGKDARDQEYANFFPVSFGMNFPITADSKVETYEHIQAVSVGWGATYSLRINQNAVESCPQKYAIFKAIRTWEDARRADAFPAELKKLLRNPDYDWHLEANPEGGWKLYQSLKGEAVKTYELSAR